jgi:hypothetical protein
MNESSSRARAFDGVPLQLSGEERAILNSLAFRAGMPLPLAPWQNRHGQNLEARGLCRLTAHPVQMAANVQVVSVAWLTAAGLRAARLGAGAGPRLAALDGEQVAGWRDFRPWSYRPEQEARSTATGTEKESTTRQICGKAAHTLLLDEHGGAPPEQPA